MSAIGIEAILNRGGLLDLSGTGPLATDLDTINVESMSGLTIVGMHITRDDPTRNIPGASGRILNFKDCHHLTLRGCTIDGPKLDADFPASSEGSNAEGHHGIGLAACTDVYLEDCQVNHIYGDFLYVQSVGGAKASTPCENVTVVGLTGWDSGRHGVTLTGIDGFYMAQSRLEHYARQAVDQEKRVRSDVRRGITIDRTSCIFRSTRAIGRGQ